jgi:RNA polymerase sigma factor (sigma-70 family)
MALALTRLLHRLHRLADPPDSASDAVLLDRFAHHQDEAAFAALLARHGPMVYRTCCRTLADLGAAEDAFQATFLILARRARSVHRPAALAGWLYGVALRVAVKARKLAARRRGRETNAEAAEPADPHPDPLAMLTGRELLEALEGEVQSLPEAYRMPVILCCLEGLSQEEAAQRLGCTPGSVRGRLERGRRRLHARLARRGLTLPAALAAVQLARASVPGALASATARAAVACAAGERGASSALPATVVELAEAALPGAAVGKVMSVAGLALILGAVALGVGAPARPGAKEQPAAEARQAGADAGRPKPPAGPQPGTDRHGDPLPPGALRRLGTLRHRYYHRWGASQRLSDGKTALTTTQEEIRRVDLASGRLTDTWPLPKGQTACGFSPDGRLVLLSDGKVLRLWDLTTRKEVRALRARGPLGQIDQVLFSSDGKLTATNSGVNLNPGLVRVLDLATGQELWQEGFMGFYDRGLHPLGFLADRKTLVVRDQSDNRISLRDRTTGRVIRSFATLPRNDTRSCRLSPDGKAVLFGTSGPAVRAWDVATGKELPPLGGHKGQAFAFAISRDSKVVLTGGQDPFVLVWDWPSGKRRGKIDLGGDSGVETMTVSADGLRAEVIVWGESALRYFDLRTGKELPSIPEAHRAPVHGVAVAADGRVVSAGTDQTLRVWDLGSGRQLRQVRTEHSLGATSLALSADGRLIATADFNRGKILLHERDTGRLARVIDSGGKTVWSVAFAPRGRLLAAGGNIEAPGSGARQTFLGLWDADTGREVRRLEGVTGAPVFSPDGQYLAALGGKRVRVWEVQSGRERSGLPQQQFSRLAFSPDGRLLACADRKRVIFWELAAGQECCGIEVPGQSLESLRFAPGGRWLAFGDGRGVCLADVRLGRVVHTFRGHDSNVNDLAFAPDGCTLVSASFDTTMLVWDVAAVSGRQPGPSPRLEPKAVAAAWDDLASADAKAAYRAIRLLAEAPAQSVPLLRERLRPAPATDGRQVERLVGQLNSARFAERDRAVRELEGLGNRVEGALKKFLTGGPSLEARRRAERLLARLEGPVTDRELLRALRAVEALEWTATAEARRLLERLAGGAPEGRLTREARAALTRLGKR